jgi:hypothetical protein
MMYFKFAAVIVEILRSSRLLLMRCACFVYAGVSESVLIFASLNTHIPKPRGSGTKPRYVGSHHRLATPENQSCIYRRVGDGGLTPSPLLDISRAMWQIRHFF